MKRKTTKILILRLSSIGDILLSTPFIRQVRMTYADAQIDFVLKKQYDDLLHFNPHINRIFWVEPEKGKEGLRELRRRLQQEGYDYVFDLHNNFRSRYLTHPLKATLKKRIHKDKIKQALLVWLKKNRYQKIISIPRRYLQVAAGSRIRDDGHGLEFFWKDRNELEVKALLKAYKLTGGFIALAPGATYFTKRWPLEYFKILLQKILEQRKEKIVILGGQEDKESFKALNISGRVVNLTGKTSLLNTAIVLNQARALVSNDSGLMHMAAAVNTPLVAVFGSTVRELGFFPFRADSIVLENKQLRCRPCSHLGRNQCPKKHFKCMTEIKPDLVYKSLKELL